MRRLVLLAVFACVVATAHAGGLLSVGDAFPPWKLTDQSGQEVSSRDLSGRRYLLWFYPRAMTPGCTAEGDGLRDRFSELQKAGIEVLGVSFDQPPDNARFVQQQGFPFRLLSDTDRTLAMAVGAADSPQQPMARRISYLVSADGKVLRAYGAVDPASHAAEVLRDVHAAAR